MICFSPGIWIRFGTLIKEIIKKFYNQLCMTSKSSSSPSPKINYCTCKDKSLITNKIDLKGGFLNIPRKGDGL